MEYIARLMIIKGIINANLEQKQNLKKPFYQLSSKPRIKQPRNKISKYA
jgi:hypothetical protein